MSTSQSLYEIRGWDAGDHHFDMSIRRNGVRFTISVSPDSFTNSPCAHQLFEDNFDKICAGDDDDPAVWDYSEFIADIFMPQFLELAPPINHTGKLTLDDLRVRGAFTCEYRVTNEQPIAETFERRVLVHSEPPKEWDMRIIQSSFPIFNPADVEVPYEDGDAISNIYPRRVFINGNLFFYKACWSPFDAVDEVHKYCRIAASGLSTLQLRTSRLFGIVADCDGHTKGLLYHWIHTDNTETLTSRISANTPPALRDKWTWQVREAVAGLHSLGIVWGDAKPDNVLIDTEDNAVIIDLEGGTTYGWVDHELGGSFEGDLQGLERLVDFIHNSDSPRPLSGGSDVEYGEELVLSSSPLEQ